MRRAATMLALLLSWAGAANAQQKVDQDGGIKLRPSGNLFIAPEIWPDVGAEDDQKLGLGIGGMIGLGLTIGNMRLAVGPHASYNVWTANYSSKPNSATRSVTFAMADLGLEGQMAFDDMVIYLGKGRSTMEGYMILDDGDKVTYPGLDGEKFGYQSVGIGFKLKQLTLGLVYTSYDDAAVDASRLAVRFAVGR